MNSFWIYYSKGQWFKLSKFKYRAEQIAFNKFYKCVGSAGANSCVLCYHWLDQCYSSTQLVI